MGRMAGVDVPSCPLREIKMTDDELRTHIILTTLSGAAVPLKDIRHNQEDLAKRGGPAGFAEADVKVKALLLREATALAEAAVAIADATLNVLNRRKITPE